MKKEEEKMQKKAKEVKTTTFSLNRQKLLKPRFFWWGWKTV